MAHVGWPGLGNADQTPIDSQQYRDNGVGIRGSKYLGDESANNVVVVSSKRFGQSAIDSDLLPADLHVRNIESRSRQADGSVALQDNDASYVDQSLRRIVNALEILTKSKVIKRGYLTQQISLAANVITLIINSQTARGYIVQNTSGVQIFIGNPGVTITSGYEIASLRQYEFFLDEGTLLYAIADSDATLQIMEM